MVLHFPVLLQTEKHACHEDGQEQARYNAMQIATMTNSTISFSQAALKYGGLDSYVDKPMDISLVQRWKPHSSVYLYAVEQLDLEPHQASCLKLYSPKCLLCASVPSES